MVLYMNGPSEKAEIAITISFRPNGPRPAAAIRHAAEALRRTAGFVLPATKKTDQAHINGGFVVSRGPFFSRGFESSISIFRAHVQFLRTFLRLKNAQVESSMSFCSLFFFRPQFLF